MYREIKAQCTYSIKRGTETTKSEGGRNENALLWFLVVKARRDMLEPKMFLTCWFGAVWRFEQGHLYPLHPFPCSSLIIQKFPHTGNSQQFAIITTDNPLELTRFFTYLDVIVYNTASSKDNQSVSLVHLNYSNWKRKLRLFRFPVFFSIFARRTIILLFVSGRLLWN